jgi:hypothetical protein
MYNWLLYSSADLVNWTDHGIIGGVRDPHKTFKWADGNNAWAPQVIARNGKFYMYGPFPKNGHMVIGVAVASDPAGPFVDPIGAPLITRASTNTSTSCSLAELAAYSTSTGGNSRRRMPLAAWVGRRHAVALVSLAAGGKRQGQAQCDKNPQLQRRNTLQQCCRNPKGEMREKTWEAAWWFQSAKPLAIFAIRRARVRQTSQRS